ncbi:MAG: hypothetical protein HC848_04855 [Limnobacter sp.]|nr:hypothetical protein [Limnobacter sp.]
MDNSSRKNWLGGSASQWLGGFPVLLLLLFTLVVGAGELTHGQMLRLGEQFFGQPEQNIQYHLLRLDPAAPDCNPNPDMDALVEKEMQAKAPDSMQEMDSMWEQSNAERSAIRQSLEASRAKCLAGFKRFSEIQSHLTPQFFRLQGVGNGFAGFNPFWV